MLHVSQRAHYGLRAMTELAKAWGKKPLSLGEIAQVERLPAGYLEQLAMPLRRAGLIEATRGAHGGYRLARSPGELTVGDVVRALEGPVAPVECLYVDYSPGSCVREPVCLSRPLWQRVKESVDYVLDATTLADLCSEESIAFVPVSEIQRYEPSAIGGALSADEPLADHCPEYAGG